MAVESSKGKQGAQSSKGKPRAESLKMKKQREDMERQCMSLAKFYRHCILSADECWGGKTDECDFYKTDMKLLKCRPEHFRVEGERTKPSRMHSEPMHTCTLYSRKLYESLDLEAEQGWVGRIDDVEFWKTFMFRCRVMDVDALDARGKVTISDYLLRRGVVKGRCGPISEKLKACLTATAEDDFLKNGARERMSAIHYTVERHRAERRCIKLVKQLEQCIETKGGEREFWEKKDIRHFD